MKLGVLAALVVAFTGLVGSAGYMLLQPQTHQAASLEQQPAADIPTGLSRPEVGPDFARTSAIILLPVTWASCRRDSKVKVRRWLSLTACSLENPFSRATLVKLDTCSTHLMAWPVSYSVCAIGH